MPENKKSTKVVYETTKKGHQADSNIQTSPPTSGSALGSSNQGSGTNQGSQTSKKQLKKV